MKKPMAPKRHGFLTRDAESHQRGFSHPVAPRDTRLLALRRGFVLACRRVVRPEAELSIGARMPTCVAVRVVTQQVYAGAAAQRFALLTCARIDDAPIGAIALEARVARRAADAGGADP